MRLKFLAAAAVGLLGVLPAAAASPTEPDAKPARQCFWANRVTNFASTDNKTINVRVGVKDVYQFEMLGACPDVEWSTRIAIVSRGSNSICTGLDAEIIAPGPLGPERCFVRNVRKLSPSEIAALPRRARP